MAGQIDIDIYFKNLVSPASLINGIPINEIAIFTYFPVWPDLAKF